MHEPEQWLKFAEFDLLAAHRLIQDQNAIIPPALVLAQQYAEKALKSYLYFMNHPVIRTHDLVKLVNICEKYDSRFSSILDDAIELNPHVTVSRYPDSAFTILDLTTARILVTKAEHIFNFVKTKIEYSSTL